jgi:hypothetical protein
MTHKEKMYLRELIVRLWYFGDVDDTVQRLCHALGWGSVVDPEKITKEQHIEIEWIAERVQRHKRKRQVATSIKRRENDRRKRFGGSLDRRNVGGISKDAVRQSA